LHGAGRAEASPGFEDTAGGPGIVAVAAQIPGVAQRGLVFRAPALPREDRGAGERQALAPEGAERVFGAGDWMQRGERRAGAEGGLRNAFSRRRQPLPARALARSPLGYPFHRTSFDGTFVYPPLGWPARSQPPLGLLTRNNPRPAGERGEGRRGGEADSGTWRHAGRLTHGGAYGE